ncbi:UPF0421 protein [Staphylococcus aureus M52622]|nr:UPF0421 protein [Staphylococcus aureus M52622]EWW16015.1 UPF0421 protein [Staphylococcus aureus F73229]EYG18440.1 UPF0421 protein [Staphylococcus aureus F74820]
MNDQWYKHLIGARTIKTGIAIFLTAVFCMALDLTPIYAILTAVVTIEPKLPRHHLLKVIVDYLLR